jgi:hypothetical protein
MEFQQSLQLLWWLWPWENLKINYLYRVVRGKSEGNERDACEKEVDCAT